jgi:hypothetical protein
VTKLTNLEIQAEQLPSRYATEETEPFVLPNPDEIIVATKGALHEHLTELAKAIATRARSASISPARTRLTSPRISSPGWSTAATVGSG